MLRRYKVLLVTLGVVLLLGVLGIGVALAADPPESSNPSTYHQVFVGKLAKILGLEEQQVTQAMVQAQSELLDEAVKEGRLTKEQAEWMKQHMQQMGPGMGPGMMGPGMMGPGMMGSGAGHCGGVSGGTSGPTMGPGRAL